MDREDDFDDPPQPRKGKWRKDPHASLEERVRREVLSSPEDWLAPRYLSQVLRSGSAHVKKIMERMVGEGVLSPLQTVPMSPDEEVKVGRRPIDGGFFDVNAFLHEGKWVIGYFDKSMADARKTVLVHARPEMTNYRHTARIRGRVYSRQPTVRMKESFANSFRFKEADWDGRAYFVLRDERPYFDACLAAGIEPKTNLPWVCACGKKNDARDAKCHGKNCWKDRPSALVQATAPKLCPDCGQPDVDGHSKRHRGKRLAKSRQACLQKVVDQVHKV